MSSNYFFLMKVVGYHKTALARQCGEAVRILKRGIVLNSKSEFSRCQIQRLSLPQPDPAKDWGSNGDEGGMRGGEEGGEGDIDQDWTEGMLSKRISKDRENWHIEQDKWSKEGWWGGHSSG